MVLGFDKTGVTWPRLSAGKPEAEIVDLSCPTAYIGYDNSNSDRSLDPYSTLRVCLIPAKLSRSSKSHFSPSIFKAERTADIWKCSLEFHPEHSALQDFYSEIRVLADYLFHEPGPYQIEPGSEVFIMPFLVRYRKGRETALLLRHRKDTPFLERIELMFLYQREAKPSIVITQSGVTSKFVTETEDTYMRGVHGDKHYCF